MDTQNLYADKKAEYFSHIRKDIQSLLPAYSERVLEIGCGGGGTLQWLTSAGYAGQTVGIEICWEAAIHAAEHVTEVINAPVEQALDCLAGQKFQLILCLDVLEHLIDPWSILSQLYPYLAPGGRIIISLPNIRHHSILLPLLLNGSWNYTSAGILDQSHLRFFTRSTAIRMLESQGYRIVGSKDNGLDISRKLEYWKLLVRNRWFKDFFTFQLLLTATRSD
ncbi:class I SAM-dependent methyltransferase [Undibacterium squillarum]|uniref:SAM-dependent methyltransferase n=1 Tax=Undibacterium squillarum TaxID=1131567 RepID=A0ABQ2XWS0_9BURK|nr:class I SAM-dependent methyltransferase [Undibacterium squillarum]GGX36539.1 SAM-dependent methyltransferase [Undibacterium squillarum]